MEQFKEHMIKKGTWIFIVVMVMINLASLGRSENSALFDNALYNQLLSTYVDDQGSVDYKSLKQNREDLDLFAQKLAQLSAKTYDGWPEPEKIAFWVNAYNALTLIAIIDHYPIQAKGLSALTHPKNSIRQIPGVWTKLTFRVMGEFTTLNEIEHQILRKKFNEPRIHMALVCAAQSCPKLRNEPFSGMKLSEQLDDQTQDFLGRTDKFSIDRDKKQVKLSPIFKWFGKDFEKTYGLKKGKTKFSKSQKAVLLFVAQQLESDVQKWLISEDYSIAYLDYDWSLNEQKEKDNEK